MRSERERDHQSHDNLAAIIVPVVVAAVARLIGETRKRRRKEGSYLLKKIRRNGRKEVVLYGTDELEF